MSNAHVLIIEPDVRLAAIYAGALQSQQHDVTTVTTAQDAVTAADTRRPDVVLLELQLVAHSGVEFLYEFRSYEDWRQVPVLIVSHVPPARLAASRQLLYERLAVKGFYYKPQTSLQQLLAAVSGTLRAANAPEASA